MKIKMPEFSEFNESMIGRWCNEDYFIEQHEITDNFAFNCYIETDDDHDREYMYGYIGTSYYYDSAIVASDDITIKRFKNGSLSIPQLKRAYNQIVKQLQKQYKQWVLDNIMKGE